MNNSPITINKDDYLMTYKTPYGLVNVLVKNASMWDVHNSSLRNMKGVVLLAAKKTIYYNMNTISLTTTH